MLLNYFQTSEQSSGSPDLAVLMANVTSLMNMFSELSSNDLVWATDFSPLMSWDWETFLTEVSSGLNDWNTWNK